MSYPFNYDAEPFQGFTEFDEFESLDELDEFGDGEFDEFDESGEFDEGEFGEPETFGYGFEMEEERGARGGRMRARAGAGRRSAGRSSAGRRRPPSLGGLRRPKRPRKPGTRPPNRPGRPGRPGKRPYPPWPGPYPGYPGPVIYQDSGGGPVSPPDGGPYPMVGRFGNWLRSGERIILLLDEDDAPLDEGTEGAGAPDEGAQGSTEDTQAKPTEGAQAELSGVAPPSRWRLRRIQRALSYLGGRRLPLSGVADSQTRNALRRYQQQKGLPPHGRADYQTEVALAYDIAGAQQGYEYEESEIDPCVQRCKESLDSCLKAGGGLQCLANWSTCLQFCSRQTPPRPPTPTPTPPTPCPPSPTLRFGSIGPAVVELQSRLNAHGATPPLKVDGGFGPITDAAVRAFQRTRGLAADGIVGPKTWAKLLGC